MQTRRRQRGAAAVEFALLMPFLMMLLLGIIEFGYAFLTQASLANAARVGVRHYVINYSDPQAQQKAIIIASVATPEPADVIDGSFSTECAPLSRTTLTLTYRYHTLTGFFDGMLGGYVTLKGVGTMQCGG